MKLSLSLYMLKRIAAPRNIIKPTPEIMIQVIEDIELVFWRGIW